MLELYLQSPVNEKLARELILLIISQSVWHFQSSTGSELQLEFNRHAGREHGSGNLMGHMQLPGEAATILVPERWIKRTFVPLRHQELKASC